MGRIVRWFGITRVNVITRVLGIVLAALVAQYESLAMAGKWEQFMILSLPIVRYRCRYQVVEPVQLPEYAGSMWRGAFGRGLKHTVCIMPGQPCERCSLRSSCLYPLFYGAEVVEEIARFASPPRPFVLEPGAEKGELAPGTTVQLGVVLIGGGIPALPHVLQGLHRAGEYGLGGRQSRLDLVEVQQQDNERLEEWRPIWQKGGPLRPAPIRPVLVPAVPTQVRLELITPLRLKRQKHLVTPRTFVFQDLLTSLSRRVQIMTQFYGDPAEGEGGILESPIDLQPEPRHELYWCDWQRWSNRQRTWMKFGGLLGYVELDGAQLGPIWPLLWLGQWLHVGSAASFGLGQYRLES